MKKETKKIWNPPVILAELSIKETMASTGSTVTDGAEGTAIYEPS